jgi:hypothetical protein
MDRFLLCDPVDAVAGIILRGLDPDARLLASRREESAHAVCLPTRSVYDLRQGRALRPSDHLQDRRALALPVRGILPRGLLARLGRLAGLRLPAAFATKACAPSATRPNANVVRSSASIAPSLCPTEHPPGSVCANPALTRPIRSAPPVARRWMRMRLMPPSRYRLGAGSRESRSSRRPRNTELLLLAV